MSDYSAVPGLHVDLSDGVVRHDLHRIDRCGTDLVELERDQLSFEIGGMEFM